VSFKSFGFVRNTELQHGVGTGNYSGWLYVFKKAGGGSKVFGKEPNEKEKFSGGLENKGWGKLLGPKRSGITWGKAERLGQSRKITLGRGEKEIQRWCWGGGGDYDEALWDEAQGGRFSRIKTSRKRCGKKDVSQDIGKNT